MNEPILSNYYLHKQIIRFCWDRSFKPSVILRFENREDGIYLTEKESYLIYDSLQNNQGKTIMYYPSKYNRKTWERKITDFSWSNFTNMLEECGFYTMNPNEFSSGLDGSYWNLEVHDSDYYKIVTRWSPTSTEYPEFFKLGNYLIDHSRYAKAQRY